MPPWLRWLFSLFDRSCRKVICTGSSKYPNTYMYVRVLVLFFLCFCPILLMLSYERDSSPGVQWISLLWWPFLIYREVTGWNSFDNFSKSSPRLFFVEVFCKSHNIVQSLGCVARADHLSVYLPWLFGQCLLCGVSTCTQWTKKLLPLRITVLKFLSPSCTLLLIVAII